MNEKNLSNCKSCGQIKERVAMGKYNEKDVKYSDVSGRLWNGRTCPQCHAEKVKNRMQTLRLKRRSDKLEQE